MYNTTKNYMIIFQIPIHNRRIDCHNQSPNLINVPPKFAPHNNFDIKIIPYIKTAPLCTQCTNIAVTV